MHTHRHATGSQKTEKTFCHLGVIAAEAVRKYQNTSWYNLGDEALGEDNFFQIPVSHLKCKA